MEEVSNWERGGRGKERTGGKPVGVSGLATECWASDAVVRRRSGSSVSTARVALSIAAVSSDGMQQVRS